ncbi:GLUG motif-containing protein [Psychrobacillus sp. NPDC096426]|uniref:GLUG motif-containing protein n=1 Tax=Psychrobacillus sp. NPDC096426 TaxID=3364491 RepID=UPI0037F87808
MVTLISTPSQLQAISTNLEESYELANDIDMVGFNFTPIAFYDEVNWVGGFTGNFDGKGFKIKNLTITKSKGMFLGLFGQVFYGTIQNVGLENVTINALNSRFSGALIGNSYDATIKNCYVNGGLITSQDESGGLLGKVDSTLIENSYANIPVNLNTSYYGGGFVGSVDSNSTITNCYSTGKVTYSVGSSYNGISGFAGFIRNNTDVTFNNCYWDKDTSGQATSPQTGINGKSTSQMKTQSTFIGWDFTDTWNINNDYPTLKVFGVPVVSQDVTVNLSSHLNIISSVLERSKRKVSIALSHTGNVYSEATRTLQLTKNVTSHIDEIVSNVATLQNANVKEYQVTSHIEGIGSNASRVIRTIRTVNTDIQPIQIITDIEIPVDVIKPVFASVYIMENPTSSQARNNYSVASIKLNRTEMTVI